MKAKGRPRLPRYLVYIWKDGKKQYVQKVQRKKAFTMTNHTPNYWEGLMLTKFKAEQLAGDLWSADGEYQVEAVNPADF